MKRLFLTLALSFTLLSSAPANAQIWQSAKVLKQSTGAIGGFGQLYFDPSEFMAYGQFTYGIGNGMQLEGRLGTGSLDFYAGMFVKALVVSNSVASIALWSGIHSQGNAFWDFAPIFSHDFGALELYFAPFISLSLGDRNSGVTMNPGMNFALRPNLAFYTELALKVSNIPSSLTAGVRYLF
jgi:hypothetical protein